MRRVGADQAGPWITAVMYALIVLTMGARFLQREATWRAKGAALARKPNSRLEDQFRIMGHGLDAAALPLLISPIVWHHHYLILIPGLIWGCLVLGGKSWKHWLPLAIMVFPYSVQPYIYVYYLGIWLWLYLTWPTSIWKALTASRARSWPGNARGKVVLSLLSL